MKTKLFSRRAIAKISFVLESGYEVDTKYRVWFELDSSLTRSKRPIFKIRFSQNSQNVRMKTQLFSRQAIAKISFVLDSGYIVDTKYRVWFDLDNSLTRSKRPIFKIRFSRNSQNVRMKTQLFSRQAIAKISFVLESGYEVDTKYRVWFDLDSSLTRSTRPIFKIRYSRNSQISVWKTNFFPREAIAKISFVLDSGYIVDTKYRVWFDLDNSLTRSKRPICKIIY